MAISTLIRTHGFSRFSAGVNRLFTMTHRKIGPHWTARLQAAQRFRPLREVSGATEDVRCTRPADAIARIDHKLNRLYEARFPGSAQPEPNE